MQGLWHKNAIVYTIDVGVFADGNGDGVGDFLGLAGKLDYLAGLNVNCIWLQPFFVSPRRDHGYDISDYYAIDPRFGTLGDFVEFSQAARERGIRIIVDLVVNHTSIDHPWFQEARSDKRSKYRDWYVWSKEKPANASQGMVFPGVQKTTWTFDRTAGEYYYHRFYKHQPDLNTGNPAVRAEISRIIKAWVQLGVSGFRVDALPFVISTKGPGSDRVRRPSGIPDGPAADALVAAGRRGLHGGGEPAAGPGPDVFRGWRAGARHFQFLRQPAPVAGDGAGGGEADPGRVRRAAEDPEVLPVGEFPAHARRTGSGAADRRKNARRCFAAFGPEPKMQLYNRGIRRRVAPMLGNDRARIEMAHSLMLTLPGTPVLRYGDEIGMGEDLSLNERDSVRTPMQWANAKNGGFSPAKPRKLPLPPIRGGEFGLRDGECGRAAARPGVDVELGWSG